MKLKCLLPVFCMFLISCNVKKDVKDLDLQGTWQLISATTTENGKSTTTSFSGDLKMIKIINKSHFAFLKRSLNPKDSTSFDAGGGSYTLNQDDYAEHLDYYKDRNWAGKTFKFKVSINQDTLIQKGIEKVEKANVDRVIVEKYLRVKP